MVVDVPWSKRGGDTMYNSGVVAFRGKPEVLKRWNQHCYEYPQRGDQETLHLILKEGMRRMIHITDLPKKYNTLRLDLLDGIAPDNHLIMHWTGQKGKDEIRKMMNE